MHIGCYLNESIDFSSIASLHISSSERYWLNRSLIAWHASGGCLKTYFNPLSLFFGVISLYSVVLITGVIMTFSSARVLIFPPVSVFCREKLWLYSSLNLAACDLIRCLLAVPMVIYSHSTTNWWFGEMICIGHISMQIMPIIVTEFTHLLIALDRYMSAKHPNWMCRPKFSTFSILAVWVFCALTVLPLKGYVNYFDLYTLFGTSFYDQAVCSVKTGLDTRERNVAFFVALYLIPNATIAYFYSKTHNELRRQIAREQINQTIPHSFDRCLRPSPCDQGEFALESHERFIFTKASPDLQLAFSIQLRNNALIFGLCSLPVQVVYVVAALLNAQLVDVLIICGFLIVSLSPIIKSANILLNRCIYWKFMAYERHQSRPPRSVSEEHLRHE